MKLYITELLRHFNFIPPRVAPSYIVVAFFHGDHERSVPVAIHGIGIGAGLQQQ